LVCCVVAGLLNTDVTLKYWHSLTLEDESRVFVLNTGNNNPPNCCNNPEEEPNPPELFSHSMLPSSPLFQTLPPNTTRA